MLLGLDVRVILQENIEAETAQTSIYFWQAKSWEYYISKSLSELPNSKSGCQYLQIFSKISISILAGDIAQDIAADRALLTTSNYHQDWHDIDSG